MFEDTYKTVKRDSQGSYSEKGSKFISLVFPVRSEEEVKRHLADIKKSYYDARHHCYAYILGPTKSSYRANDDGEPSGTAGRPIYGQLLSRDLTNVLVVVVRYFGGTKLGVPGLINAYRTAAADALDANEIVEKTVEEKYGITFGYEAMNRVMQILKTDSVKINSQAYDHKYRIDFTIRRRDADAVLASLRKIENLDVEIVN